MNRKQLYIITLFFTLFYYTAEAKDFEGVLKFTINEIPKPEVTQQTIKAASMLVTIKSAKIYIKRIKSEIEMDTGMPLVIVADAKKTEELQH